MALILSVILFAAFVGNVVLSSVTNDPILGDVAEMLVLFAASIAFVAAILQREAKAKSNNSQ